MSPDSRLRGRGPVTDKPSHRELNVEWQGDTKDEVQLWLDFQKFNKKYSPKPEDVVNTALSRVGFVNAIKAYGDRCQVLGPYVPSGSYTDSTRS